MYIYIHIEMCIHFLAPSVYTLLFRIICNVYTLYIDIYIYKNIYIYTYISIYIDIDI